MQLVAFRVSKFRNIEDSGWVKLEDCLTCIVGKNQSGKTSLLRALHKLNPHEEYPYDMSREWPRGNRRGRDPKHFVVQAKFKLDDDEQARLGEITSGEASPTRVIVSKNYDGEIEVTFPEASDLFPDALHPNDVDEACNKLPTLQSNAGKKFQETASRLLDDVKRLAREGRFSELAELRAEHQQALEQSRTQNAQQPPQQQALAAENAYQAAYIKSLQQVINQLQQLPTMHSQAHDYLVQQLPTFIYMDDYREFQGTALLDQVLARQKNRSLTPEDETLLITLNLAGLRLGDLVKQGQSNDQDVARERMYDLSDGAKTLTDDVAGRWGQAPYRVVFRADGTKFFIEIEETNKNVGTLPLEEQSKGFRWFFSFDLRFMHESDGSFEGCVLLLDEPGLHLHPGGQKDLLLRLDEYAAKNTLVYTTHLPFLVDLREPDRIRVIHEVEGKATVTESLSECGSDEKLTLQAALGMSLDQSYLVSDRNLVVEGVHDYWLIMALSSVLERMGEDGLPDGVMVSAAGGAPEVVPLATFMIGQGLSVVALFDSDDEGRKAQARLQQKWLTRYQDHRSSTLLLGDCTGASQDFAVEDLFTDDYYLRHANEAHKEKLRRADEEALVLGGDGMLAKRCEHAAKNAGVSFNKGSVAKLIRKELMRGKVEVPKETLTRARGLFKAIRDEFGD